MEQFAAAVTTAAVLALPGAHDWLRHCPLTFVLAGHAPEAPQTACVWQTVGVGPHGVPTGLRGLAGHVAAPLHIAAWVSQVLGAGPQTAVLKLFGGHVAEVPVHVSATSHPPLAAARHTAPALPAV